MKWRVSVVVELPYACQHSIFNAHVCVLLYLFIQNLIVVTFTYSSKAEAQYSPYDVCVLQISAKLQQNCQTQSTVYFVDLFL